MTHTDLSTILFFLLHFKHFFFNKYKLDTWPYDIMAREPFISSVDQDY